MAREIGKVSVRTALAVTSSGEETNQQLEASAEFCAKAGREGLAAQSKGSILLASVCEGRFLQLALASSTLVSCRMLVFFLKMIPKFKITSSVYFVLRSHP